MAQATARSRDPNGYLAVKGCPISSSGIFQYSAAQVGLKDGDPNRVVNVFRPESSVTDPGLIASLQNVPLINDHEMLSGLDGDVPGTAPEEYGIDGVLYDVKYADGWLRGDVKMFSRSMQADLAAGKGDLSIGYTCDFILQPGEFDGQTYEVIQTNMRGNHIALVGAGRVPGARVLDKRLCFDHFDLQPTQKESPMAKTRKAAMDSDVVANLRTQLKALLPAFEQFLNEEAQEPEHQGAAEGGQEGAAAAGAADPATAVAATPTEEPASTDVDPSQSEPVAAAPAGAEASASGGGLPELLTQLEAVCSQMRQAMSGNAEGAASGGDEDPNQEAATMAANENNEGAGAGDAVQGLAEDPNSHKLNVDSEGGESLGEGGQGTASPGPAAGKHTGQDAALRAVYADTAKKTKLYDRLSKVVGAFDGALDIASATADDVAKYGIKKLKLTVAKGQEHVALDAYLTGVEAARRTNAATTTQRATADAATAAVPAIEAYFKE